MTQRFRSASFLVGDDDVLLRELGAPYGHIAIADYEQVEVICLADARRLLKEAVERELIHGDTAAQVEGEIAAAGVLADMGAIYVRAARRHPMPRDLERVMIFETACAETPKFAATIPQGRIVSSTGENIGGMSITTLSDGLRLLRSFAKMGFLRLFDLTTLMCDMSAAGLAVDDAGYKAHWDGLTEDERREITTEVHAAHVRKTTELIGQHPLLSLLFVGPQPDRE